MVRCKCKRCKIGPSVHVSWVVGDGGGGLRGIPIIEFLVGRY